MPTVKTLTALLFAATCIRHVIDATDDPPQLNQLARLHLGITDAMDALKNREGLP